MDGEMGTAGSERVPDGTSARVRAAPDLRSARDGDLPSALALLRDAGLPAEGVAAHFESGYVVAVQDEEIVGMVGLEHHGSHGLLRSLVVAPEARGSGLGRRLAWNRIQCAADEGMGSIWLLTTTAAEFFRALGFESMSRSDAPGEIQQSSEFASVCPASAELMRFELAPAGRDAAEELKSQVRTYYGSAARQAAGGAAASCCGSGGSGSSTCSPITSDIYEEAATQDLPEEAVLASLGCGNPTALASIVEGEIVLDLGSGGGIDVLLSARRVGPTGKVYGLDMTDEMLELARENRRRAGVENVEFLKGDIEAIPLPDRSVDLIISNCVINLASDKGAVLREAFRVLRPGGRFAVSDIVVRGEVPDGLRRDLELWMGCVAGALEEGVYRRLLGEAGFEEIEVEPIRIHGREALVTLMERAGIEEGALVDGAEGRFMSAFIRARRPS